MDKNKKSLLTLNPFFDARQTLLESVGVTLLCGAIFFEVPFLFIKDDPDQTSFIILLSLALFFVVCAGYWFWKKLTYDQTTYVLSEEGIKYHEGFFNIEAKDVSWNRVYEIGLKRNIIQRMFGLGTIVAETSAMSGGRMSGIRMTNLEDSEVLYQQVRDIWAAHKDNK